MFGSMICLIIKICFQENGICFYLENLFSDMVPLKTNEEAAPRLTVEDRFGLLKTVVEGTEVGVLFQTAEDP